MSEYIGYKDTTGDGLYNMGLTDEEVIRCRDCEHMDRVIEFADGDGWSDSRIGVPFCCKHRRKTMEENFCSWAMRRS